MESFTFSWVDLLAVLLIVAGVLRGRKRGMSEELLDVIKWTLIVVGAGMLYAPMGEFLSESTVFSLLSCYVAMYALVFVVIKVTFALIRRSLGEKAIGSDAFGNAEYYLGMAAGAYRYTCVLIVALAILNARYYSPEEVSNTNNYQERWFGSIRFPTLSSFQHEVFQKSLTGTLARNYLAVVLIRPTAPEHKSLGQNDGVVRARERNVHDLLDKR